MEGNKITQVAAGVIWENGRFMICKRPQNKKRGSLWEFPGGKLEPGESACQALVRECMEELNILIQTEDIIGEVTHEYSDMTVSITFFNASIIGGSLRMLEHDDIKWILPEEVSAYDFCPADTGILSKISHYERR